LRVAPVALDVSRESSQSSSSCRASRDVLFDKLDTAKMHGLDTSNVSSRVESRRDEPSGIWAIACINSKCDVRILWTVWTYWVWGCFQRSISVNPTRVWTMQRVRTREFDSNVSARLHRSQKVHSLVFCATKVRFYAIFYQCNDRNVKLLHISMRPVLTGPKQRSWSERAEYFSSYFIIHEHWRLLFVEHYGCVLTVQVQCAPKCIPIRFFQFFYLEFQIKILPTYLVIIHARNSLNNI